MAKGERRKEKAQMHDAECIWAKHRELGLDFKLSEYGY